MAWFVEALEIMGPGQSHTGRWRLTATSDEDGGGPWGDNSHDHGSESEAIECERCQDYVSRRTGTWRGKKATEPFTAANRAALRRFVDEVERRGAHYAAMMEVAKEWGVR